MPTESQTNVYATDMVDYADEYRRTTSEANQVVTVTDVATTVTHTLVDGQTVEVF